MQNKKGKRKKNEKKKKKKDKTKKKKEEKTENNIEETIDHTQKIKKNNKKLWIILLIFIIVLMCLFFAFDIMYFSPCAYHDGDVSKWEESFPNHSAYKMGLNNSEMPVFKDTKKALKQAKIDYSDAIKEIQKEFNLLPLTKYTYRQYKTYGWQITCEDEMIKEQGIELSQFLDIYENSFIYK